MPEADELLIHKTIHGDTGSFGKLVDRYQHQIYNLALRMVENREDARDVAQETFIKAFNSLSSFRYESGFKTWLFRIASNTCLDYLRRRNRDSTRRIERPPEESRNIIETIPSGDLTPEENIIRKEKEAAVKKALDSLPEGYRLPLVMHHYQKLSYREISKAMNIPERTVATRLYRAKMMLREIIAGGESGEVYPGERKTGKPSGWRMHAL